MKILLDDIPIEIEGRTLAELLHAARNRLKAAQRVIVDVRLDGLTLTVDEIHAAQDRLVEGELKLFSADPRQLAAAALEQAREGLLSIDKEHEAAADLIQRDQTAEALGHLSKCIEIWMQVRQAISHVTELVGLNLTTTEVEGKPMSVHIDELFNDLKGLKTSISAGDHSGLADSLAYEWPIITDRWREILLELAKRMLTWEFE